MSIKLMQQIQSDHADIQKLKNKKEKNYDDNFSKLNDDLEDLKFHIDRKFNIIMGLLSNISVINMQQDQEVEDKPKIDRYTEDIPSFIPDIDTSGMSMNSKEEEENIRDSDLESRLEALDELIK